MFGRFARPSALRAASLKTPSSVLSRFQARGLHQIPQLQHDSYFKAHGVPDFMSPEAYDFAWTQYQTLLVDKLNLLTNDTIDADAKPGELLVKYSRRPEMASSPTTTKIPESFARDIVDTCSSVESLKLDFLATANAMFGPGFVWLAKNLEREGLMQIFCTYNAGSPYPAAHARRQPVDMATHSPDAPIGNQFAGSMGAHSQNQKNMAPGAIDVQPILCVNTWEHAWMMDYGIGGKEEYLERWWDRINWDIVFENYNAVTSSKAARLSSTRSRNF
ncbi:hypothetical protein N7470_004613 [Penicillium chermesinum]|nr:hypothetical protein N7470_004613 [Penicillium chermesinum]